MTCSSHLIHHCRRSKEPHLIEILEHERPFNGVPVLHYLPASVQEGLQLHRTFCFAQFDGSLEDGEGRGGGYSWVGILWTVGAAQAMQQRCNGAASWLAPYRICAVRTHSFPPASSFKSSLNQRLFAHWKQEGYSNSQHAVDIGFTHLTLQKLWNIW